MQDRSVIIQHELDYIEAKLARTPYLMQFTQAPYPRPMPQVNLTAAGRIYRVYGHITDKANEGELLDIHF